MLKAGEHPSVAIVSPVAEHVDLSQALDFIRNRRNIDIVRLLPKSQIGWKEYDKACRMANLVLEVLADGDFTITKDRFGFSDNDFPLLDNQFLAELNQRLKDADTFPGQFLSSMALANCVEKPKAAGSWSPWE